MKNDIKKGFNKVKIQGRLFDYQLHPMTNQPTFVGEGRLEVPSWRARKGVAEQFFEFNVRWFGNRAAELKGLEPGTEVIIEGALSEDLRVSRSSPNTTRSKVYIDIYSAVMVKEEDE